VYTEKLLKQFPIISDQIDASRLQVVLSKLEKVLQQGINGDIVEFGCYIGTTSLFIQRLLNCYTDQPRLLHVYDSFAGLPLKGSEDNSGVGIDFQPGVLATSKKQLLKEFQKAHLKLPIVHKAWFEALTSKDVPTAVAFGFLDGDFYSSILTSLQLVWPRLQTGGIVTIDDYQREALPGVTKASEYFFGRGQAVSFANHIAFIQKAR